MLSKNQKKVTCLKVFEDCKISILINLVRPINNAALNNTVTLIPLFAGEACLSGRQESGNYETAGKLYQILRFAMLNSG